MTTYTTVRRLRARNLRLLAELAAAKAALHTDALTGLSNRRGLAAAWPAVAGCTLALIDLDGFKPVNDLHGHAAGDHVLQEVARRIAAHATVAARLGGDEFVAVLPHAGVAYALAAAIADPVRLATGWRVRVTASIGITAAGRDLPEALRRADVAMYAAKKSSKAVAQYTPHLHEGARAAAGQTGARLRDWTHLTEVVTP